MSSKINLFDLTLDSLTSLITGWGFEPYRARQVWRWLYQHHASDFSVMANLPQNLRESLDAETTPGALKVVSSVQSFDGETRKLALELADGQIIETVLMRYEGVRRTACVSTQAGCAMGCVFCATGQMGFARHLSPGEIVEQAMHVSRLLAQEQQRLSNIVLMGMGEPFHNYDNTLEAIRRMMDEEGLNIGQRHLTVSTVGIAPAIRRFADEQLQVRLAISLHAATNEARSALLPINRRYPLNDLMDAVRYYIRTTNRRVTFEWALIAGKNDTPEEAHRLGQLLQGLLCHVNMIPLNPTQAYQGQPSDMARVSAFVNILEDYNIPATVRVRRGIDVNAGCGQLKAALIASQ
nr:23S rRNA (adenine(2503)-C(2))-methyltransferase RlmN [Anaerolineae bacterium]